MRAEGGASDRVTEAIGRSLHEGCVLKKIGCIRAVRPDGTKPRSDKPVEAAFLPKLRFGCEPLKQELMRGIRGRSQPVWASSWAAEGRGAPSACRAGLPAQRWPEGEQSGDPCAVPRNCSRTALYLFYKQRLPSCSFDDILGTDTGSGLLFPTM